MVANEHSLANGVPQLGVGLPPRLRLLLEKRENDAERAGVDDTRMQICLNGMRRDIPFFDRRLEIVAEYAIRFSPRP
jgi:hypothetical protein